MSRTALLPCLPFVLTLVLSAVGCAPPEPPTGVVFVTIDTLRADHLPSYGYPRQVAPFLTELAADGAVFERAISSCSHTAPSHASLFTGLHPPQHRVRENGQPLDPALLTLAELFNRKGYATGAVTTTQFLSGLDDGFDQFTVTEGYNHASGIVDHGIAWLETLEDGEPFFLWLHFFDVHEWYRPEHLDPEMQERVRTVEGLREDDLIRHLVQEQGVPLDHFDSEEELLEVMHAYDGQILAVDRELRRFQGALSELQRNQGTVWVVTSDHGEGLGNHGFRGHGRYIYNEQLHVPLIFHAWDGRWRSRSVTELVELVDVPVTLAGWVDASFGGGAPEVVGRPLDPLLSGDPEAWRGGSAFSVRRPVDAVRQRRGWAPGQVFALQDPRFKVIVKTDGPTELYDLVDDPRELHDLGTLRSRDRERLERRAAEAFARLVRDGETVRGAEIDPRHIEELKALGYL